MRGHFQCHGGSMVGKMEQPINLNNLSIDELAGVVNLYPWFAAARKQLCIKMNTLGGDTWGDMQYADAALYIPSRRKVADLLRTKGIGHCEDKDVKELLKSYISEQSRPQGNRPSRQVYVVGGDYFSQDQYDKVRRKEDSDLFRFSVKQSEEPQHPAESRQTTTDMVFCTETMAQIYAEQGYFEQAKDIYSKLILAYPEKNAYFAALIRKLNEEIKN
ncbi:MAG: hypothetical protein ACI3ZN_10875 [Candidatus Cryptobacteroides sp.]